MICSGGLARQYGCDVVCAECTETIRLAKEEIERVRREEAQISAQGINVKEVLAGLEKTIANAEEVYSKTMRWAFVLVDMGE
jgi:uncharacterized protein YsxB (DUF464 family)